MFEIMKASTYHERNIVDLNIIEGPLPEEFDFICRFSHPWINVDTARLEVHKLFQAHKLSQSYSLFW